MLKRLVRLFLILGMVLTLSITFWGCGGGGGAVIGDGGGGGDGDGDGGDVTPGLSTPVVTTGNADTNIDPGEIVTIALEGVEASTVTSVAWAQSNSVHVTITPSADGLSATVALPDLTAYKNEIITILRTERGRIDEDTGERVGVLVDRWQVMGYAPLGLEEAEAITIMATVETTSGTSEYTTTLMTHLPFQPSAGLRNVPIGIALILQGETQATYDWALAAPTGSAATLMDATDQNPYFTPDIAGTYIVTVTDLGDTAVRTLNIYAGTWKGAITGQDANARPLSADCILCHDGVNAPDKFTDWKETGHAEIFSNNLDTSTHYGEGCFACHTVGFNTDVSNKGFDDSIDYQSFLDAGLLNVPGDNWTTVLNSFPSTAQKANIQCENCHGPNQTPVHNQPFLADHKGADPLVADTDKAVSRVSYASEVCGACHGEPARHARFQQWQESGHANLALAAGRGTRDSCSGCHSANGFIAWSKADFSPLFDFEGVAVGADTVEPISCVACHDPHKQGTTTGEPNTATVRLSGTTPELMSGIIATGVGRGATCMVCHNQRRGAYNTSRRVGGVPEFGGNIEMNDQLPHHGAQGDIMMGENAFFTEPGDIGAHAKYITDTCTNCHMQKTDPPADLSHNLGGTNHTFEASKEICSSCHLNLVAADVQGGVTTGIASMETAIVAAVVADIEAIASDAAVTGVILDYDDEATTHTIIDDSGAAANTIASAVMSHGHGLPIEFTLDDGTVITSGLDDMALWQDLNTDGIVDVGEVTQGDTNGDGLVDSAITLADTLTTITTNGQNIAKARWNFELLVEDSSLGVHNPSYVNKIITKTLLALTP
jgi:formate-dependent nitrite reductase cytochrome c552 subunit